MKRRRLSAPQEVILIYDVEAGFIQQQATFKEYRRIRDNNIEVEVPVFERQGSEINGLQCFWVLPTDLKSDEEVIQFQHELIELQYQASALGYLLDYQVPEKIKDKEIRNMVESYTEHRAKLTAEFGYDPLDYSWVERELSETALEKSWFAYQREHKGGFSDDWENTILRFKAKYSMDVSIEQAFDLSRKWKRFLIGAWNTIASRNVNLEDWKSAAREFEEHHRNIEERMSQWTAEHKDNFPMAKVIEPVHFRHGPYFNQCIERVPHIFTDATCYSLRAGVVLQVVSYDPIEKYIRLDFTSDIRDKIKPEVPASNPGMPLKADYVIYVPPIELDKLEFLGSL